MFEAIKADLRAHDGRWGAQGFWALCVYRFGRWRYRVRYRWLRKVCSGLYRFSFKLVQVFAGIELPCEVQIGKNFVIDHFGGIVISGHAVFGDNCRVRSGVVVGLRHTDDPCAPVIGNNVDIGTGAKLLGKIRIGNNVSIGANAVVISDIPDDSVAIGVPAVAKPKSNARISQRAAPSDLAAVGREQSS